MERGERRAHVSLAEALLLMRSGRRILEIDRALALDPKSAEALALKAKLGGAW